MINYIIDTYLFKKMADDFCLLSLVGNNVPIPTLLGMDDFLNRMVVQDTETN